MSTAQPSPSSPQSAPPSKPRNPVERVVVWGLILGLVALVGWEAMARFGYTQTLNRLQAAMEDESSSNWEPLGIDAVDKLVSGFPTKSDGEPRGPNKVVVFRWKGLLKDHGGIHVIYETNENTVLGLETDAPPDEPEPIAAPEDEGMYAEEMSAMEGEGGGGRGRPGAGGRPGGGGPGGGGAPGGGGYGSSPGGHDPDDSKLMLWDVDSDGKLTIDEVPTPVKARFPRMDLNSDGFVEEEEITRWRGARGNPQDPGAESQPGGEQRPQRPDLDGGPEPDGDATGETPAAAADDSPAPSVEDKPKEEKPAEEKPAEGEATP